MRGISVVARQRPHDDVARNCGAGRRAVIGIVAQAHYEVQAGVAADGHEGVPIALRRDIEQQLTALRATVPQIADIRGPGAMIAVEFGKPSVEHEPDTAFAKQVQTRALKRGLLLFVCGIHSNVIRFLFPLTIEDKVFDEATAILEDVLKETATAAGCPMIARPADAMPLSGLAERAGVPRGALVAW